MKCLKVFAVLVFVVCLLTQASPVHAEAVAPAVTPAPSSAVGVPNGAAMNLVKHFYAQLTSVMKQGDKLGFAGRYKTLEPTVKAAFNLPLMTRYAVGLVWSRATAEEQKQLTSAFSDFTIANYASRFMRDNGERFDVIDEKPTDAGIIVETKLTPKDGEAVALNYLVRLDEKGNYRIIDVLLDGTISELALRRSEFSAIANRDGVAALVNSLGDKAKQMGPS